MYIFYIIGVPTAVITDEMSIASTKAIDTTISLISDSIYIKTDYSDSSIYLLSLFSHYIFLSCKDTMAETTIDTIQTEGSTFIPSTTTDSNVNGIYIITSFYPRIYFFHIVFHHFALFLSFQSYNAWNYSNYQLNTYHFTSYLHYYYDYNF